MATNSRIVTGISSSLAGLLIGAAIVAVVYQFLIVPVVVDGVVEQFQQGPPGGQGGGPPPSPVRVGQVQLEPVQQLRLVSGELRAVRSSQVAAEEAGRVIEAPPDSGSSVSEGDVLAKLDTRLLEAQRQTVAGALQQARASVVEREAELKTALRDYDRLRDLFETGAATEREVFDAQDAANAAEARLAVAKANVETRQRELRELDVRLEKMEIHAPYDGYITEKAVDLGQWVRQGDPVGHIIDSHTLDAWLDVPQTIVRFLEVGDEIDVNVRALDRKVTGRVHRIVPSSDSAARTFPVLIRIDNPRGELKAGMSVEADLPIGQQRESLTIPKAAVRTAPTGQIVYVVRGDTALPVVLNIRFGLEDRFVVDTPQLAAGDLLVIEGNERLMPGQKVAIQNPPPGYSPPGNQPQGEGPPAGEAADAEDDAAQANRDDRQPMKSPES